jgi:hypothetical protein
LILSHQISLNNKYEGIISVIDSWGAKNSITRTILLKDLRFLLRDRKFTWIPIIFMVVVSFVMILTSFYILNDQIPSFKSKYLEFGILIILFGTSIVIMALMDKFSVDLEGNNISVFLTSPSDMKNLVLAKIIGIILLSSPIVLIKAIAGSIFMEINFFVLAGYLQVGLVTICVMAITASITFPNFKYETLFDIPTIKARLLMNLLSTFYITSIGISLYMFGLLWGMVSTFLMSIVLIVILFKAGCKNITGNETQNHMSISELWL